MMARSKGPIDNRKLFVVLRIVLGGIFLIAGVVKLLHQADFASLVVSYHILPYTLAMLYGYLLPWAEIIVGCILILGPLPRLASLLSIPLIVSFMYASGQSLLSGAVGGCGCFAQVMPLSHWQSLFLDGAMLIMASLILLHKIEPHRFVSQLFTTEWNLSKGRRPRTKIAIINLALVLLLLLPIIACGGGEDEVTGVGTANQEDYGSPYKVTVNVAEDDLNIAFGVITDTHVDADNCDNWDTDKMNRNREVIKDINIDCADNHCLGVVHMGDMVDRNNNQYVVAFRQLYENDYPGYSGGAIAMCKDDNYDAYSHGTRINFPVFPTLGNHDVPPYSCSDWDKIQYGCDTDWTKAAQYLGDRITGAQGVHSYDSSTYAWRWGNYYFIQLGLWAGSYEYESSDIDQHKLNWLKDYLAIHVGDSGYGVLIFQHYGWDGFSTEDRWWTHSQRDMELEILRPYNVLGIFTGHVHSPKTIPIRVDAGNGVYIDNYSMPDSGAGSGSTGYSIVTLTGEKLKIATKNINKSPPNEWSHYEKDIKVGPKWRPMQWSSIVRVEGLGYGNAGAGTAIADINGNGKLDLLLMGIAGLDGANEFQYRIGWDMDASGTPSNWSSVIHVSGLGWYNDGGGAAIADINNNGKPDLLLMGIDNPDGSNSFWYKIGWDLKADGNPTSWSSVVRVGGLGSSNAGGGAAIADINGNGQPDLLLMDIDNPEKGHSFWYKIGWDLNADGNPTSWSSAVQVGGLGSSNDGGGAAIADLNGNGQPDLLLMGIDNPPRSNEFWYKIGWDLNADGNPTSWSHLMYKGGLGHTNAGGGAAIADLNGNGQPELLLMGIDDPVGLNKFWYTIGWDFSDSWS